MVNTVTQRTLVGSGSEKNIVRTIHIVSDGSEESDLVIYDNSAFINDTSRGKLMEVQAIGSDCIVRLEWDQSTDAPICSLNPINGPKLKFWKEGGNKNPNAAGATGDIVLTTANLDSGDEVIIKIWVRQ